MKKSTVRSKGNNMTDLHSNITGQADTKKLLPQINKDFQVLLDLQDSPVLLVDSQSDKIVALNKSAVKIYGSPIGELISKKFGEIFINETLPEDGENIFRIDLNGKSTKIVLKRKPLKLNNHNYYFYKLVSGEIAAGNNVADAGKNRNEVLNELITREAKYQNIFDDSPISLWEEDLSAVKNTLEQLQKKGVKNLQKYLLDNPALIKELISKVILTNINKATLELYRADTKSQMMQNLPQILSNKSRTAFVEGICTLFSGKSFYESESVNYTLKGNPIYISLRSSVVTGYEKNWEKILISIVDITEKKKSEDALKESEDKFRIIAEKSLTGVYLIQDELFKYVNPKFAEIFRYKREEIEDKKGPSDFAVKEFRDIILNNIKRRLSGEIQSLNYEFKGITKHGEIIDIEVYGSRINYLGKPAIVGTLLDVTERKKRESELQESQKRYRELTDLLPQTIFEIDEKGKILFVNQSGLKAFDYSQEDLKDKPRLYDFLIPKDRGRAAANMFKVLKGEKLSETEYTAIRKNGITFPILVFSNPILRNGKATGIRGIAVDLSERKLIEEQLRKLSRAVEQSPSSIIITDLFGEIEYVNPRFTQVSGFDLSEVIGKNPRILKSGETSSKIYKNLWETVISGKTWRGELYNKKKNGELYWEYATISPIVDNEDKITHFLAIKEDITQKKLIENELLRAKEKAEESDRLKSEFLAQMSHEIRSPLNIILNFNSFLKEELKKNLSSDQKLAISSIESAGKRLLRTIDLILNMAALQNGYIDLYPTDINLNKILVGLSKEFKRTAQNKKIKFAFINKTDKSIIKGDEYIVSEIFVNIIDNALKYTPQGQVEIILYNNAEKKSCVDIKDTGIGISEDYIPKLFLPFSQEETGYSRKYEGNGLGLALVKKYADLLGAKLKVESQKGAGTTFTVVFARYQKN